MDPGVARRAESREPGRGAVQSPKSEVRRLATLDIGHWTAAVRWAGSLSLSDLAVRWIEPGGRPERRSLSLSVLVLIADC